MLEWTVSSEESGLKLLIFLKKRLGDTYSSRFLKSLVEQNYCQINGRTERFASTSLGRGDHISLSLAQISSIPQPAFEESRVLYQDEVLLIYNKPAGVNCDEKGILQLLKSTYPSLHLVHRLDRDTTGVLILARQKQTFESLVQQFKNFEVEKYYLAIVDGIVKKASGKIENYLGKKKHFSGQTIWGEVAPVKGLYACTEWKRLKVGSMASLIGCSLKTGRTHQIRVHMAGMGHPLLGDFQYGKDFVCPVRPLRYLLHAEEVRLRHPNTGKELKFTAPLPEDFNTAKQKLFK